MNRTADGAVQNDVPGLAKRNIEHGPKTNVTDLPHHTENKCHEPQTVFKLISRNRKPQPYRHGASLFPTY